MTEGKWHKQRPGWLDFLGVLADEADGRGDQAVLLEDPGQHTHGVRAQRSSARQKNHLHTVCSQEPGHLGRFPGGADRRVGVGRP